jgi:4-diphosphocytidyl-2-C-methyl-D-erythritol kinase
MTIEIDPMQVLAPAKVNLSLRVLCRRPDGFHEIETFISPISLYDELTVEKTGKGIDFQCDEPSVPRGEANLVVRAAQAFFAATATDGASIHLAKRIPHGAGLGGGSSDAASTLLALDRLFETNLTREALAKLAEPLGSDIPFFIFESAAVARGRGELISGQRVGEPLPMLLLKPRFGVPTPFAYSRWQNSVEIPGIRYDPQDYRGHTFVNDLERPVFEKFVFLARMKMWLLGQSEVAAALMSGSGSTIFAVLRNPEQAEQLSHRAKQELDPDLWTWVCTTLGSGGSPNRHGD